MEGTRSGELMKEFINLIKTEDCVSADLFYEKMGKINDRLEWSKKMLTEKEKKQIEEFKVNELEVLTEGYRCLAQIHINLLRDFDIFRTCDIRKYSAAFNYISKIYDYKNSLIKLGYEEKDDIKKFCFKQEKTEKDIDNDETRNAALKYLSCYMEALELMKLRYDGCGTKDLVELREKDIKENLENYRHEKMDESEIKKLFEKCELCDNEMNNKGVCTICAHKVADFVIAQKHVDFIRKEFQMEVKIVKKENPQPINDDGSLGTVNPRKNQGINREKSPKRNPAVGNSGDTNITWTCKQCTFINQSTNLNCTVCEGPK